MFLLNAACLQMLDLSCCDGGSSDPHTVFSADFMTRFCFLLIQFYLSVLKMLLFMCSYINLWWEKQHFFSFNPESFQI